MFNERSTEYSKKQGKEIPVWISPKYEEAKKKAIELINEKKYNLTEGDFWILMNETKKGQMGYTGLIISHNGCLKINDALENKVKPEGFEYYNVDTYKNSLIFTYCDDDVYEIGEVNDSNCKNDYPYAMAFKRCFDRVVLKKSKLAYAGVYSDSEAEEFAEKFDGEDENELISDTQEKSLRKEIKDKNINADLVLTILKQSYDLEKLSELKIKDLMEFRKKVGLD